MTPNQVTETFRSTDTTTEHNTKQKPKVRFMANNNILYNTNNNTTTISNTNNAQSNNTTDSDTYYYKYYTITKYIEFIESIPHVIRMQDILSYTHNLIYSN